VAIHTIVQVRKLVLLKETWNTSPMAVRVKDKKKIALVLSGGGIKAAAFHIGVCLALKEKGFKFAGGSKEYVQRNFPEDQPMTIRSYVGSSAGAFVSAILSAGYSLEALVNAFNVGAGQKPHYRDHSLNSLKPIGYKDVFSINGKNIVKSLPLSLLRKSFVSGGVETLIKDRFKMNGLFTTDAVEGYLQQQALSHNDFKQLGVDLFIVGTQLNHTRKAIFGAFKETTKTRNLMFVDYAKISQAVAASISLPPIFAPYGIPTPEGKTMYFFDGEIRDTLSTHVAADHGADLVIASYSVQPYHYTEDVGSLSSFGIPAILNQALYQVIQQKIDRHIQHQADISAIYKSIDGYFKAQRLPDEHREKILEIVRSRVNYKPEVDYLYIHPRAQNYEMFFADHFSLNPQILEKIVRVGFKSAISKLRQLDL
jgi:predicted acylesterase/phospholipase RssA